MSKNNRSKAWPIAIISSIIAIVISCIITIIISLDYPVEMDTSYMQKHQKVDETINEILADQTEFDNSYSVKFLSDDKIEIKSKKTIDIKSLKYDILLTRPETNAFNQYLNGKFENGILHILLPATFSRPGRWQLLVRLSDNNISGFFRHEFFVK